MHGGLGLEKGLGLGLGNTYGLGLEMEIVRLTCEVRAEGLGFGKVLQEGLGLEKG